MNRRRFIPSMRILMKRICIALSGLLNPSTVLSVIKVNAAAAVLNWKARKFWMLWNIDLPERQKSLADRGIQQGQSVPSSTAGRIVLKLSSTRIMSAASLATSVPLLPIEIPMSAIFNAGASLTRKAIVLSDTQMLSCGTKNIPPSPVIATTAPLDWKASTIAILCFGVVRAKTLTLPTRSFS